ncbi:MAG: hypothetical protein LBL17_01335 [Coxiellaceae bacterium]|jgi:hypothetical protein|nr:hypothetical protein [Coxiellaceae bacterium]
MDDRTTSLSETAEYKFTESEADLNSSDSVISDELKQSPAKFSLQNAAWRRFLVPGSIVIAILLLYAGFNFYAARKTRIAEQKKITLQEGAALVQKQDVKLESAPKKSTGGIRLELSTGSNLVPKSEQIQEMQRMQSTLQQKVDNIMQYVQQVIDNQGRITTLNDSVAKIEQDLPAINQNIEQLTSVMQQTLQEVEKLKISLQKPKKKVVKPPVAYHVCAIVPGRVWLESAEGKNVTLRVGDKLEGYGVVRVISPRQGMVIMSNGSIIQYGVNDF